MLRGNLCAGRICVSDECCEQSDSSAMRTSFLQTPLVRKAVKDGLILEKRYLLDSDVSELQEGETLQRIPQASVLCASGEGLSVDVLRPEDIPSLLIAMVRVIF